MDKRIYADQLIGDLRASLAREATSLDQIPALLLKIIEEHFWRERVLLPTREIVRFETFEAFVTAPPREGLGTTLATLRRLCETQPAAWNALDRVTQAKTEPEEPSTAEWSYADAVARLRDVVDAELGRCPERDRFKVAHILRTLARETEILAG